MLALAGCQPAPLSVEEAKKITTEFQNDSFVPPPRTIDDITAILDQQKPDPALAEANRKAADAAPPPGASAADLAKFYYQRSLAARQLGRFEQNVADLQEAARLGGTGSFDSRRIYDDLMHAQLAMGNDVGVLRAVKEIEPTLATMGDSRYARTNYESALAIAYANVGDFANAEQALASARALLDSIRASPNTLVFVDQQDAIVLNARATIASQRGRYAEAETALRESLSAQRSPLEAFDFARNAYARSGRAPLSLQTYEDLQTNTILNLAGVLREEGKLLEAEVYARRALLLLLEQRTRYAAETMHAVTELALVLNEQGRYADAERLGHVAVTTYESLGAGAGSWPLADARSLVGAAQAAQGKWSDAQATFRELEDVLGNDQQGHERYIASNLTLAVVYLNTGKADLARPILERAAESLARTLGSASRMTAVARGLLGVALAQTGQAQAALAAFDQAVPALLDRSHDGEREADPTPARDQITRQILEADMASLADARGASGAEQAFALVDAAHGQSAQRAVLEASARTRVADPDLADLVRRDQDTQMRLTAAQGLLADLLSYPTGEQAGPVASVRSEIDTLGPARDAIHQEIARRFPGYARLVDPAPPSIAEVQRSLKPGEALIATHVGADRIYVWAVPKEGHAAFAAMPLRRLDLQAMVATLRRALNPRISMIGDIPPFDVATAAKLYDIVLKPVEPGWKGAKTLIVVPDNLLAQIPWTLLVTAPADAADRPGEALFSGYKRVPFLVRQAAVAQLPSVAALGTLRGMPAGNAGRRQFVGFGDPWFNPQEAAEGRREQGTQVASLEARGFHLRAAPATETMKSADISALPRLPDTAEEVREVAASLKADPQQDVFLGAAANEQQVRTMKLDDRRVVMFATHGLVPGDLDGLAQPALALTAPSVAGVPGDGLLTLDKILALKLDADWVVLSACNTAAGEGRGSEAVSGLGSAFFYAGARALLVTNWPVETRSARLLTTSTFRHQAADASQTRSEALRQSELDLIDGPGFVNADSRTAYSYAHPLFWAPFSLVGDGG